MRPVILTISTKTTSGSLIEHTYQHIYQFEPMELVTLPLSPFSNSTHSFVPVLLGLRHSSTLEDDPRFPRSLFKLLPLFLVKKNKFLNPYTGSLLCFH